MNDLIKWLTSGSSTATFFVSILALSIVTIILMFLIAFIQGREISFWPPKIGKKNNCQRKEAINLFSEQSSSSLINSKKLSVGFPTTESTSINKEISEASSIYFLGMNLRRTLTNYYGILEKILDRGGNLKFLLVDPQSEVLSLIAERNYVFRDENKLEEIIKSSLDTLNQLKQNKKHRGSIELRILKHVPAFGLLLIDSELPKGRIRVDIYPYRVPPDTYPCFWVINNKDNQWFNFFRNQFFVMWESATPYN